MNVTANGLSFSLDLAGQGPPILFVHGFPLNRHMWVNQTTALAATHRIIAPDLRGFGQSSPPPAVMTMDAYADDLAALLDALGISEPITYCGLSMGGYIAFAFARRHRDRLARLILFDTKAAADPPEKVAERERTAEEVLRLGVAGLALGMPRSLLGLRSLASRPHVAAFVGRTILEAPRQSVAAALRGMAARPDSTGLLSTLDVPTLVLCGEQDAISPPAEMRAMTDLLPNATFVEIPHAGHLAPLENPSAANDAFRRFLHGGT